MMGDPRHDLLFREQLRVVRRAVAREFVEAENGRRRAAGWGWWPWPAIATRCRMPPDSCRVRSVACWRSTRASHRWAIRSGFTADHR